MVQVMVLTDCNMVKMPVVATVRQPWRDSLETA